MRNKRSFLRQVDATKLVGTTIISVMMIAVALSSIFVLMPETVKADAGTVSIVGHLSIGVSPAGSVYYNHSIYMFGGINTTDYTTEILRYFPQAYDGHAANSTDVIGDLNFAHFGAAFIDDVDNNSGLGAAVWLIGGTEGGGTGGYSNMTEIFWLENETVANVNDNMSKRISGFQGCINSTGIIWTFGGKDSGDNNLKDITCYNPSNKTWWRKGFDLTQNKQFYAGAYSETQDRFFLIGGKIAATPTDKITVVNLSGTEDWDIGTINAATYSIIGSACWNDQNDTILLFGGDGANDDIQEINCSTGSSSVINNMSVSRVTVIACWGINDTSDEYVVYAVGGSNGDRLKLVEELDLNIPVNGGEVTASSFTLSGLDGNSRITWSGEAGDTVWSNATSYGTLTIQTNINATDNCTAIYLDIADFDSTIDADNISVEVRNTADGTFDGTTTALGTSPDYNLTIDSSAGSWFQGTNPFPMDGAAWTNVTLEVRFKCAIPSGASPGTYLNTSVSWNVNWKVMS